MQEHFCNTCRKMTNYECSECESENISINRRVATLAERKRCVEAIKSTKITASDPELVRFGESLCKLLCKAIEKKSNDP